MLPCSVLILVSFVCNLSYWGWKRCYTPEEGLDDKVKVAGGKNVCICWNCTRWWVICCRCCWVFDIVVDVLVVVFLWLLVYYWWLDIAKRSLVFS